MTTNMELLAHHVENWAKERGLEAEIIGNIYENPELLEDNK